MAGPLQGLKVVELAGIGPAPLAGMLLANLGAEVLLVKRPSSGDDAVTIDERFDLANRGKEKIVVDLKNHDALEALRCILDTADVLIEGYRPGVLERLGLGPTVLHARNPRLVIGRMTGWGGYGPLAKTAGHDINYISISGALAAIGPAERPIMPLNLLGDFGGGTMFLVFGIMSAIYERQQSGQGQVVDTAMIDGVAALTTSMFSQHASGRSVLKRQSNVLDGGRPFYDVYQCADGGWVSVGALEAKFFADLIDGLHLDPSWKARQHEAEGWPEMRRLFTEAFAKRPRDEWARVFWQRDTCVAPVLQLDEVAHHPHHAARGTYASVPGEEGRVMAPAPAPRFDRTPAPSRMVTRDIANPGALLRDWGVDAAAVAQLVTK